LHSVAVAPFGAKGILAIRRLTFAPPRFPVPVVKAYACAPTPPVAGPRFQDGCWCIDSVRAYDIQGLGLSLTVLVFSKAQVGWQIDN